MVVVKVVMYKKNAWLVLRDSANVMQMYITFEKKLYDFILVNFSSIGKKFIFEALLYVYKFRNDN